MFDWFGLVRFATKNKKIQFLYSWFQTCQSGGQQYSDTSPFSNPCFYATILSHAHCYRSSAITSTLLLVFQNCLSTAGINQCCNSLLLRFLMLSIDYPTTLRCPRWFSCHNTCSKTTIGWRVLLQNRPITYLEIGLAFRKSWFKCFLILCT
jgi:hypothetical protein